MNILDKQKTIDRKYTALEASSRMCLFFCDFHRSFLNCLMQFVVIELKTSADCPSRELINMSSRTRQLIHLFCGIFKVEVNTLLFLSILFSIFFNQVFNIRPVFSSNVCRFSRVSSALPQLNLFCDRNENKQVADIWAT